MDPGFFVAAGALGALASAGCDNASGGDEDVTTVHGASVTTPQTPLSGNSVAKFVDPLPTFNGRRSDGTTTSRSRCRSSSRRCCRTSFYTGLPAPFNERDVPLGLQHQRRGRVVAGAHDRARRGVATTAIYTNSLTNTQLQSLLTVDQTIHWADPLGTTARNNCVNGPPLAAACEQPYAGPIPAVVHLHGNEVFSQYDGHPDAWWTPGFAQKGRAFFTNTYNYVEQQEATTLWFHDHTLGIVRLNVYAGLTGFYFIRDDRDTGLANNPITLPAGPHEVEMMLADRQFERTASSISRTRTTRRPERPARNPDKHPFWIPSSSATSSP